jgi:hypothetical protein
MRPFSHHIRVLPVHHSLDMVLVQFEVARASLRSAQGRLCPCEFMAKMAMPLQTEAERKAGKPFKLRKVSFRGNGLQPQMAGAGWQQIRDAAYQGRGA